MTVPNLQLIMHIQGSIIRGWNEESGLCLELLSDKFAGMSSNKVRHFLNNLCNNKGWRHLEIGTHKGSTLLAAGYKNPLEQIVAIENFSDFGEDPPVRGKLLNGLSCYAECMPHIRLLEQDCWKVDKADIGKFNTYFYDGSHTVESQAKAFTEYWECLETQAVIVIDDYDNSDVQEGTARGIKELGIESKIVKRWHLEGGDKETRNSQWWNGLCILMIDKDGCDGAT